MANKKQLALLKRSVKAWNKWREKHPDAEIDLRKADLSDADLRDADLSSADFRGTRLIRANLTDTDLFGATLSNAHLISAELSEADLRMTDLKGTRLISANLLGADLSGANLSQSDLSRSDLSWANLSGARVNNAILEKCGFGYTVCSDVDLSTVKGLESAIHTAPSIIGIDTIYKSRGKIPEAFLRGAGVPENFITYMHSLTGAAFEFYSCFISYSAKDQEFADRLHADLQSKGVRVWFFSEDAKWGETVWGEIDRSIKIYDKLVVLLSANSLHSGPVLHEIERALNREDREGKNILFPIRIDDYVFQKWEHERKADVTRKVIGDFSHWKDHDAYHRSFTRLLRDLQGKAEAKAER